MSVLNFIRILQSIYHYPFCIIISIHFSDLETKAPQLHEPIQGSICIQRPTFPIIPYHSSVINIFHSLPNSLTKIVLITYSVRHYAAHWDNSSQDALSLTKKTKTMSCINGRVVKSLIKSKRDTPELKHRKKQLSTILTLAPNYGGLYSIRHHNPAK